MEHRISFLATLPVAILAAWFAAHGEGAILPATTPALVRLVVSASLHVIWLNAAIGEAVCGPGAVLAWALSILCCRAGLEVADCRHPLLSAAAMEGLAPLLSLACGPPLYVRASRVRQWCCRLRAQTFVGSLSSIDGAALPEEVRERICDSAERLAARAEMARSKAREAIEQEGLAAAAEARAICEGIAGLPPEERRAMANIAEDRLLEILRSVTP